MLKWVIRLAWIAGICGLIGSILIIVRIVGGRSESAAVTPKSVPPRTTIKRARPQQVVPPDTAKSETVKKPDTTIAIPESNDNEEKRRPPIVENNVPVAIKKESKPAQITIERKKVTEKVFTRRELEGIVKNINSAKRRFKLQANCVQIHQTIAGNNKRAMRQLEKYLKSRRFSIAGRETVDKKTSGVKITRAGNCVRVTIGGF